MPDRGTLGWLRDTAIDTSRGVTKTIAAIPTVVRDINPDSKWAAESQKNLRELDELQRDYKTEKGRFKEETGRDDAGMPQKIAEAIITQAPAFAAGALLGPEATAGIFAAQGYTDPRMQSESDIYGKTEKQLRDTNQKYIDLRDRQGLSDADARKKLYSDSFDPVAQAVNTGMNLVGGYGLGRITNRVMGTAAKEMTDGILKRVGKNALEGGIALGGVTGAGEYATEAGQKGAGFRASLDPDEILKKTLEGGEMGLALGGGAAGIESIRGRRTPVKPSAKVAEPQGADIMATLAGQLDEKGEPRQPAAPTEGPSPTPEQIPTVTPTEPAPRTAPEPSGGAWPAQEPAQPAAPTTDVAQAPAGPGPGPAPGFTREQLAARMSDVNQTPDHGTALRHIAEWQKANPNEKLGADRNTLLQQAKATRDAARQAAKAPPVATGDTEVRPEVTPPSKVAEKVGKLVDAPGVTPPPSTPEEQPTTPDRDTMLRALVGHEQTAADETRSKEDRALATAEAAWLRHKLGVEEGTRAAEKVATEAKAAETKPAEPKRTTLALTGEEAKAKLAEVAQKRSVLALKATEEQVKAREGAATKEQKGTDAERQALKREDLANMREQAAHDIREANKPTAEALEENKVLERGLDKAQGESLNELLKPVIERAKVQLAEHRAAVEKLGLEPFDPGAHARARKAGPYHTYMVNLHNFVRGIENDLREKKYGSAKTRAREHLAAEEKMREEGGAEEIRAKKRETSAAQTVERRSSSIQKAETQGEGAAERIEKQIAERAAIDRGKEPGAEDIEDEVQRAIDAKPLSKRLPMPKRDKHGRMIFPEADLKQDHVGGKEQMADPMRQAMMGQLLMNESRRIGRQLTLEEARGVLKSEDKSITTGTYGQLLPSVRGAIKDPILQAIFDRVHELVKDIPVTVWSHDAMQAYANHHGMGRPRAFHSNELGEGAFRHDTLVPRTIFHEALHAATNRAIETSPRFEALLKRIQEIAADRFIDDPRRKGIAYQRGILSNQHEFISELFTRPELGEMLKEVNLRPWEIKQLEGMGYRPGGGRNLLKALWDGFLKAIGFKAETPNAYKVAVDLVSDMFDKERTLQKRDIARGEPLGVLDEFDRNNLRRLDPVQGPKIVNDILAGKHGSAVNDLLNLAKNGKFESERAADAAVDYLHRLNEDVFGTNWTAEEEITPVSNARQVADGFRDFLRNHAGETGKEVAFKLEKPLERLRSNIGYGLTWTHKLAEVGERAFREHMGKALDVLQKHEGFAAEYMAKGGDRSKEPAQRLLSDLAALKHSIKDKELWERFEQFMVRESAHTAYADEALGVGKNKHIDANALVDEQTRSEHAELQKEWNDLKSRNPEFEAMRNRLHEWGKAEQEARSREVIGDMGAHLGLYEGVDRVAREAFVKRVRNEQATWTAAEKRAADKMAERPDFEDDLRDVRRSRELVKLAGPYVPFMRRGRWSLLTKIKVAPDAGVNFKPITDTPKDGVHEGYDFAREQDAKDFIRTKLNPQGIAQTGGHEVVLDKRTGKIAREYTDDEFKAAEVKAKEEAEKAGTKYVPLVNRPVTVKELKEEPASYPNAQLHYRVTFNPRDYQMFDSEREAHEVRDKRMADTSGNLMVGDIEDAPEYKSRANAPQATAAFQRLIDRVEAKPSYQGLSESDRNKVKRELRLESMRIQTTSSRRARFLPRTYAKGASTDLLQNYIEFATSQAHSMADLRYRAEIADAIKSTEDYNASHRYYEGAADRDRALNELKLRAYAPPQANNAVNQLIGKALRYSQVGHLADIGYLVTNATDNWVNALPVVGAKHGYWKSARTLLEASKLFSPKEFASAALGDIKQAWLRQEQTVNYERLANEMVAGQADAKELGENFRNLFQKGLISKDAGMEVQRLRDLDAGVLGRSFERVDGSFRAAAAGVETHNRVALATAAYRLEFDRTKSKEAAIKYAEDMVRKGAGDYSTLNRPRLINQPWLRLGMQFKQFPMRILSNYTDAIMGSFDHNATPEYRSQMRKQLAFMLATQSVVAGALGLPLGPASGAVNAGYMLGLWDSNWDDVTGALRKEVARYTGNDVAEVVFHGLPRILGIDMSRLGQGSFFFNQSPDTQDVKTNMATLAMMAFGAPGDSAQKLFTGVHEAKEAWHLYNNGAHDQAYDKALSAADHLTQVKAASDLIRAGRQLGGGPATRTRGGVPLGNEYDTYQAILRAIGITSAREAEASEKRRVGSRILKQEQQAHTAAVQMFVNANDKELSSIWRSIQENYNPQHPDAPISFEQLLKARNAAARTASGDRSRVGLRIPKKNQSLAGDLSYYNT